MIAGCSQDGCSVAETGICALELDPCPHRTNIDFEVGNEGDGARIDLSAPIVVPPRNPTFPLSLTLSPEGARKLMAERYCHLVGIVGAPDAGKTAAIVSLYLMLAKAELSGFRYANSETLRGLDEISRGARQWNEGQLPDQLTERTEMVDDRQAGFLHVRVRSIAGEMRDLLLPDLPGEWSNALIESNRTDRLDFLGRADVIWLMVDGRQLTTPRFRQHALHRTKILMQRLAAFLRPLPPVILVITRIDQVEVPESTLQSLRDEATSLGLDMSIAKVASFADPAVMKAGTGIAELIKASVADAGGATKLWPADGNLQNRERSILRFGTQ